MSVIVNEIKREVRKVSIETQVVGKSYTITVSEQTLALLYYLVGSTTGAEAAIAYDVLSQQSRFNHRFNPELNHCQQRVPAIRLPGATSRFLQTLSTEVE